MRAGRYEVRADGEAVQEPGTGRDEVEPPGALGSDAVLHEAGGGREKVVGGDGADDDRVDLRRFDSALRQRAAGRQDRHIGGSHLRVGNMALADARALHDPLVVGIDQLFQVLIG